MSDENPSTVRHPWLKPGTAFAFRRPDGTSSVLLPPETSDEDLEAVRRAVDASNDFLAATHALVTSTGVSTEAADALKASILAIAPEEPGA